MHLLIISNMEHYLDGDAVWGWGPTVQEINYLSTLYGRVSHVGCLHKGKPTKSSLPYTNSSIRFVPLPPAGGKSLRHKLGILRLSPLYLKTIWRELRSADVVHVRCPANIPLLAILLLSLVRRPVLRWVKYAGNWQGYETEPLAYRFQRWWLKKNLARSLVTINGEWPRQPSHVASFYNPCLTEKVLEEGLSAAPGKEPGGTLRLLFVGALNEAKGVVRAIQIMRRLNELGDDVSLDMVGDGPDRRHYEKMVDDLGLSDKLIFHGWIRHTDLSPYYAAAHCILLPSKTEGWPKVLSEAMAFGVVPIAASVSAIPQYLDKFEIGRAVTYDDLDGYIQAVKGYVHNRDLWQQESTRALECAHLFSYKEYLGAVSELLNLRSA